ncbi:hypothetical protein MBM_01849 [Drepanopeziza brunnea f. sp. 'multigermtubi' MB_m1]|uniref:Uncharacterized protein n=1 Tax=Marssonina brunnea f. sp. multigermtubi (strain MB_m1) TaxID=1072389 RepID=K1X4B2_MARBU|nr:uncharacterized protein MBM_01849 [Drepanopeziza brunnea f. sp. 'multigermtubi' MB_m1]EKD19897.1 hypothetical protein MBM_01849 [Drepanopeziza brunnea f. sp. 'multigermtubi' MB_m1]
MADRATGLPSKESSRQRAVKYYTLRVSSLSTEPPAIQPKGPLYPGLLSLSERPDDEMSGISFDLNELPYAKLDNKITARAIVNDFLDTKCLDSRWTENLTDDEDNTPQPPPPPLRSPKRKEKEEGEEIRRLREEFAKERKDMEQNIKSYDEALQRTRRPQFINRYAIRQSYKSQNHLSGLQTLFLKATPSFLKSLDRVATKIVLRLSSDQTTLEATGATRQKRTRQNLRAFRTKSALAKDSVQISVPNLSNPRKGSSTLGRTDKLPTSFKRPRISKKKTKGIRIAKSALKGTDITKLKLRLMTQMALAILTMTDEKETEEISKEIEATDTEEDPRKGRTTGNYIGNLLPIRPLAKHNTPAYGTPSALDDNNNDFLKLRATDPHPRAKELAFECFEKLAKELKGIQSSLRPGLRDDRSLANKLYSAYKNVPETTITRMNFAFTSTAAVADIRRAIVFATESSRPAKAKAYASSSEPHDHTCFQHNTLEADSDLDEEYECFIQDRQYFESKKAAKATKASIKGLPLVSTEEFDQFIAGLPDEPPESGSYANISEGFVTTYGTFDANEVYKQLEIQTAFHALTS